jgi:hypothetical protein
MGIDEMEGIERAERLCAASERLKKALLSLEAKKGQDVWLEPKGRTLYVKRNYEVEAMRRLDNARF